MATSQEPVVVEKVFLICTEGAYKYYDIELQHFGGDNYKAVGFNGGIKGAPADPQSGKPRPQSADPVPYAVARAQFDALEQDKLRKYRYNEFKPRYRAGEEPGADGAPAVIIAASPSAAAAKERTDVFGFLPKPIDDARALELVHDDNYDASQKLDGDKKYATHRRSLGFGTNKLRVRVPLPAAVSQELALIAKAMDSDAGLSFDGEEMSRYWVYDLLELGGRDLRDLNYCHRQESLLVVADRFARARAEAGLTGEPMIRFLRKANTTEEKLALMRAAEEHDLEGVVFAHKHLPGQIFKWKRWRELDVVCKANTRRSVEGFVYVGGILQSVGNVNISEARYREVLEIEARGERAVAEVKCIYASGDAAARGQLEQGSVKRIRTDKLPEQCTGDQLDHCLTKKIVVDWTQRPAA